MSLRATLPLLCGAWLAVLSATATRLPAQSLEARDEQVRFFETHIRPVLAAECYSCHSQDAEEVGGRLLLDTREGTRRGGETGPAVVPGNSRRSLLIKAIKQQDSDLQMPPEKKLPPEVIANFEKWIAMGAPDPRDGSVAAPSKHEIDIEQGRQFWAFQPPRKAAPPDVRDGQWPRSDVDRFVLARLEQEGLKPVGDSDASSLLRRLHFDLVGLPPDADQIERFAEEYAADPRAAVAAVADTLLDSPRFGERWGRHWLDVARYAESTGQAANFAYPQAWRYRDWVIDAFNDDRPYDQFVREQLAGDLLPAADDRQRADQMIATGFLAIGPKSLNERNRRQFQMDLVDEQIDATFQAFQALTVACARCHDHRFDPIPQSDYYALAGIFRSSETCYGTIRVVQSNHPSGLLELPEGADVATALEPLSARQRALAERQIEQQRERLEELTGRDGFIRRLFLSSRVAQLRSRLEQYDEQGRPRALAMGVQERRFAFDSPVYIRGEIDQPSDRVRRGFPQVLTRSQPRIGWQSSGRRELADWIASEDNPLTARVMVNRVWLHLFGRGLVATPDNFGAAGQQPSHPELLDYLAVSFMEEGWSIKRLIRSLVLSRTYQLSAELDAANFQADPENVLLWRMPRRRLEAEALRDTMLLLGGRLELQPPRGSSIARSGEGRIRQLPGGDPSAGDNHRSVYLPIVRDQVPEMLTLFDFPDPSLISGERATTTIPAQSLFLLNNPFVIRQADGLATRLLEEAENDSRRIRLAYQRCYSRLPSETETSAAARFLEEYSRHRARRAAWTAYCQAMLASAEFAQR